MRLFYVYIVEFDDHTRRVSVCVCVCVCADLIHLLSRDHKGDDYAFFCIVSYWLEECPAQGAHNETLVTD